MGAGMRRLRAACAVAAASGPVRRLSARGRRDTQGQPVARSAQDCSALIGAAAARRLLDLDYTATNTTLPGRAAAARDITVSSMGIATSVSGPPAALVAGRDLPRPQRKRPRRRGLRRHAGQGPELHDGRIDQGRIRPLRILRRRSQELEELSTTWASLPVTAGATVDPDPAGTGALLFTGRGAVRRVQRTRQEARGLSRMDPRPAGRHRRRSSTSRTARASPCRATT